MFYEFPPPAKAHKVPNGPDWLHEVKYDRYRMMLIRGTISRAWRLHEGCVLGSALRYELDRLLRDDED